MLFKVKDPQPLTHVLLREHYQLIYIGKKTIELLLLEQYYTLVTSLAMMRVSTHVLWRTPLERNQQVLIFQWRVSILITFFS